MDDASFQLLGSFLPATYIQQAKDARNTRQTQVNQLLEKVTYPFIDFFFIIKYSCEVLIRVEIILN